MTNPEFGHNPEEEQADKEYLEQAKKVGDYYHSLIEQLTGKEAHSTSLEGVSDHTSNLLNQIASKAEVGFSEQYRMFQAGNMDAKSLLKQVKAFEEVGELNDASKYRMEELSEGVFAIFVKPELARQLRSGAQGVAVKLKGGISFVLLPEYDNQPEFNEKQRKENIPHEVHHLAWGFARGDVITSTEQDQDFRDAFLMFQDEVMARLSSNGALAGYTHIDMLDPETKAKFKEEHPDTADRLSEIVLDLNDLLSEIREKKKRTEFRHEDLILAVIEARNFAELKTNLLKAKTIIEKQPTTVQDELETGDGWGHL